MSSSKLGNFFLITILVGVAAFAIGMSVGFGISAFRWYSSDGIVKTITETRTDTSIITSTVTNTVIQNHTITVTPTPPYNEWIEVTRFSGDGDKNTEPFTISGKYFRISWSYETSSTMPLFAIFVITANNTGSIGYFDSECIEQCFDFAYFYEKGEFYCQIIEANIDWWEILIEEIYD